MDFFAYAIAVKVAQDCMESRQIWIGTLHFVHDVHYKTSGYLCMLSVVLTRFPVTFAEQSVINTGYRGGVSYSSDHVITLLDHHVPLDLTLCKACR